MKKRSIVALVFSLLVVILLANIPLVAASKTKLVFWKHNHSPADEFVKIIINDYKKVNPNVEIVFEIIPSNNYTVKLLTAITAGSAPDIFDISDSDLPVFMNKKVLAPAEYKAMGYKSLKKLEEQWLPTVLNTFKNKEGKVCGIPFEFNSWQLFINTKHYREAGLDPDKDYPKTWDELLRVAQKLTKVNNGVIVQEGFDWPYNLTTAWYHNNFEPILWQQGGAILSPDGKKCTINSKAGIKAAQIWSDMVYKYKASSPLVGVSSVSTPNQDFIDGKLSMWVTGPWATPTLEANSEVYNSYKVVPMPQMNPKKPVFVISAWAWFVASTSKQKSEAWKFIDYASKRQPEWLERVGYIIPRKGWFDSPQAKKFKYLDVFLYGMEHGRAKLRSVNYAEISQVVQRSLQKVVMSHADPKQAMDQAKVEIDRILQGK
jgi:multiple sugar transport system substrate-binding protein